ncbi:MAG TPA: cytochrome b/b6 domain-containing protein [bacterium]|jgi:Ni/Fe-hydrogenase 1 B-type cytochrome subunit|nr:cytochrome b/b6 domain-containing protein [bacterium]
MAEESVYAVERVFRRSFMWRVFHWGNALSIVLCTITGIYIAHPFFTASIPFLMAWIRAFHFYAAVVLDVSVLALIYLYFFSHVDPGVKEILPKRSNFVTLQEGFLNLVLLNRRKRFDSSKADSWNAMWFTVLHVLVLLQMFTGFQLYVEGEAGGWSSIGTWWPSLLHTTTDWTLSVFGSPGGVRTVHLITMYFIIGWAFTHIYYEVWRTIVWREGDIGIVFSGHKFARRPLPVQPVASASAIAPAATGSAVGAPDPGSGP